MSQELSANVAAETLSVDEIIAQLNRPYNGTLPVKALRAAQARREEITPHLIKLIQDATHLALEDDFDFDRREGHFFALFLLAEFHAKEALPVILEALSLPGSLSDDLFGDVITEYLPRMLPVLMDDSMEFLSEFIANDAIYLYVRWSMAATYLRLVKTGRLTREEAVERLRKHLVAAMKKGDWEFTSALVCELGRLSAHEARDEIDKAFRRDLVDRLVIDEKGVESSLDGLKRFESEMERCQVGIPDTVDEFSWWAAYRNESEPMSVEEILEQLNQPHTRRLPVEALRAAQARREEITPHLITSIGDATRRVSEGDFDAGELEGHFYALFLLTEFRAKEALPVILEALSLPDDLPRILYSDTITDGLSQLLAVLADDRLDAIDNCIRNDQINLYVRWSMASVFQYLVRDGKLSREEAVARLRGHLAGSIERREEFAGMLISELVQFSPQEAEAEIEEAFQQGLVDPLLIDREFVKKSCDGGEKWIQDHLQRLDPSGIADTVEELSGWHCYQEDELDEDFHETDSYDPRYFGPMYDEDPGPVVPVGTIRNTEPRVGRNEPCPCGSGKKYKKCCGKP